MDKGSLQAFDSLYGGSLCCALLCDENFTILRANKYSRIHHKDIINENQLVKYFMSPNRYMAVIKLRSHDCFDAVLRMPDRLHYSARICKISSYSSYCTVTLAPYREDDKDGGEKSVLNQSTLDTVSSKFNRGLSNLFDSAVKLKETLDLNKSAKDNMRIDKLASELHAMLCTSHNISMYRNVLTNNIENDVKRMNINHFLNLLFQEVAGFFENLNVDFTFSITLTDIITYVDPKLLILIVDNIVTNAYKFHTPGTKIKAKLTEKDDCYCITVQNRGELLPRSATARIFDPYRSFDDTPDNCGIGLGLTITKKLSEVYGGSCKFSSTAKYGNVCIVTIPIVDKLSAGSGILSEQDPFSYLENYINLSDYLKSLYL